MLFRKGGAVTAGDINIRWGWLKGMNIYPIVVSVFFGEGIILMPETMKLKLPWPVEKPTSLGIAGSVYVAFGFLSILGLLAPLKFMPVLLT